MAAIDGILERSNCRKRGGVRDGEIEEDESDREIVGWWVFIPVLVF